MRGRPRKPASPEPRECPAPPSDTQRADRRQHGLGMFPPNLGLDVDVDLDLVAVGIRDVDAVGDGMVGHANDVGTSGPQIGYCLSQLIVGGAHLEAKVVHANAPAAWNRRGTLPHLDQGSSWWVRPEENRAAPGISAGIA